MPSHILTDVARDLWVERFSLRSGDLDQHATHPWSVTKRVLRGGRRDGVDLIEVDNGALSFSIVPTRGMGLWKGQYQGDRLGWDSPVHDGPVHPAFVNLMNWGGLGWLEGFDEVLARCGLENNGGPYQEGPATFGLHGKIANLPASFVAVHVADDGTGEIAVEGQVEESKLFSPQIRMTTRISTTPGSNRIVVRDEFLNRKDAPGEMQILYHWNFGPPYLEAGARFVAPVKAAMPRNARARAGLDHYETFAAPEPGFAEQVYFLDLHADPKDGRALVMLRNRAGDKAVVLRFTKAQVPAFTLWKCTGGAREGYVTGLEPGTNYPNPKPFEKARGRVVPLAANGRYLVETVLELLKGREAVAAVEAEVQALQGQGVPTIHPHPGEPFTEAT